LTVIAPIGISAAENETARAVERCAQGGACG
jgi:hypothetical protein